MKERRVVLVAPPDDTKRVYGGLDNWRRNEEEFRQHSNESSGNFIEPEALLRIKMRSAGTHTHTHSHTHHGPEVLLRVKMRSSPLTHSLTHSFTHSLTYSQKLITHSLTYAPTSLAYSLSHSFAPSPTHSLTHSQKRRAGMHAHSSASHVCTGGSVVVIGRERERMCADVRIHQRRTRRTRP